MFNYHLQDVHYRNGLSNEPKVNNVRWLYAPNLLQRGVSAIAELVVKIIYENLENTLQFTDFIYQTKQQCTCSHKTRSKGSVTSVTRSKGSKYTNKNSAVADMVAQPCTIHIFAVECRVCL